MDPPPEVWKPIEYAPNYAVSSYGAVKNISTDRMLKPSKNTTGIYKVTLAVNKKQITRSVKTLVAETFVEPEFNPYDKEQIFDTPMLLDNDQKNLHASNIVWRPRWFACTYTRQFDRMDIYDRYGPFQDDHTQIIYKSAASAAKHLGVLPGQVIDHSSAQHWRQDKWPVFPIMHTFTYLPVSHPNEVPKNAI